MFISSYNLVLFDLLDYIKNKVRLSKWNEMESDISPWNWVFIMPVIELNQGNYKVCLKVDMSGDEQTRIS